MRRAWTAGRGVVDPIPLTDWVVVTRRDPVTGGVLHQARYANTITSWARAATAQWFVGAPLLQGLADSRPLYMALGTGTPTPSSTDVTMFNEAPGTRLVYSYRSVFQAYTAQITTNYAVGQAVGTWYEAGLWDAPSTATTLAAQADAGATTISVTQAPTVYGTPLAGQYTTAYIHDGASSETVSLAAPYAAGASSWTIQTPLQYTHASGTAITVFTGNLWAHVSLGSTGETQPAQGSALSLQWSLAVQAN